MLSSRITSTPSNSKKRADLIEVVGFHFDLQARAVLSEPVRSQCSMPGQPISREEMVVFHRHHVERAEPMVGPPAGQVPRPFKLPQTRSRLTRVENLRPVGACPFDKLARQSRNAAEVLEKIERDPFSGEDRTSPPAHLENSRSAGYGGAILLHDLSAQARDRPGERLGRHFRPGDNGALLGDRTGGSLPVFVYKILARDIATADVFTEREIDQMEIFLGEIHA